MSSFQRTYITEEDIAQSGLYKASNTSFSGADIVATMTIPGLGQPLIIGELQTISYSIHRPKVPVRALGRINPKGFVRCGRTIAGSLVFTVFNRHLVHQALDAIYGKNHTVLTDEMPPFEITITFANESGQVSSLSLYGIQIVNEGQTMSVDDMITENVMNYIATGITLLKDVKTAGNKSV